MNKISENENLIKNIVPKLCDIGWTKDRMVFEHQCSEGRIDLLYKDERARPLAVLEVKAPGKGRNKALDQQAIPYAKSVRAPIAIAWDGSAFLATFHIKTGKPLKGFDGNPIRDYQLLSESNLLYFRRGKNNSLKSKIKTLPEIEGVFKKLNRLGKSIGLATGIERVVEIGKIMFIKMLCDNDVILDGDDWTYIKGKANIVRAINERLREIRTQRFEITNLEINRAKQELVREIVGLLDDVSFNHQHYDIAGSLFQEFLSERARGGTTNDLGQYFTPKKVIELLYSLSQFKDGDEVYDPYCGTGGILIEFFLANSKGLGVDDKKRFGERRLYGSEITLPVAMLAKMNLIIAGDGHSNIESGDSLSRSNKYNKNRKQFNIVATNIPFVPETPSDVESGYFPLSGSSSDISNFIEHCINRCKRNGRVVLIAPKGFLTEQASVEFRRNLLKKYRLEAVYFLYDGIFNPYTPSHSCLLVISKKIPAEHVDFFSVKEDCNINTAIRYHKCHSKYDRGFYRISVQDILHDPNCDLRGKKYQARKGGLKLMNLVDYVDRVKSTSFKGKKKMTTPNSIQDGIKMMETKANRQVDNGAGSFLYEIIRGAIVIARITNKRVDGGRYLGSALAGDDYGNLITGEYHQVIPKNPQDTYFILHWIRNKRFQEIVELSKGTAGQQRIDKDVLMNEAIPEPTDELRDLAKSNLEEIERCRAVIEKSQQKIDLIKKNIRDYNEADRLGYKAPII